MTAKSTWFWIFLAAGLFGAIYALNQHRPPPNPGPPRILPELKVSEVTRVQVLPANGLEIQVDRTNGTWLMTKPLVYPAQPEKIEAFLRTLEGLTAAAYITPGDLKDRPNADEEYGFTAPLYTIILEPGNHHLHLGLRTVPGDQVFLQVVGGEGIYVVDADFLKTIASTNGEWRSTKLIDLQAINYDRVTVTNAAGGFGLQRDAVSQLWRILPPIEERADSAKIEAALQALQKERVGKFVTDEPGKADLENFGLASADLELAFAQGTNLTAVLQFGKSPTNDTETVYARQLGQNSVVCIPSGPLASWREKADAFRDPHLVELTLPVTTIEVRGGDAFSLERQAGNDWRVMPQNFPADPELVSEMLSNLCQAPAAMVKGVVIPPDLGGYGLAPSLREYVLESAATNSAGVLSNRLIAGLDFGTNAGDKIFARRTNESAVYSISQADFERLPGASWQLRERQIWDVSTNDIAAVVIRQGKKVRRMLRAAPFKWSLAPGSQGALNELAVEVGAGAFAHLTAAAWVGRGEQCRSRYGFESEGHEITIELKSGEKRTVEFGGPTPSGSVYAAVMLDGTSWIFEFPDWLYQYVPFCLSIPDEVP
jgi:Domain of unknown function (DUF4340)